MKLAMTWILYVLSTHKLLILLHMIYSEHAFYISHKNAIGLSLVKSENKLSLPHPGWRDATVKARVTKDDAWDPSEQRFQLLRRCWHVLPMSPMLWQKWKGPPRAAWLSSQTAGDNTPIGLAPRNATSVPPINLSCVARRICGTRRATFSVSFSASPSKWDSNSRATVASPHPFDWALASTTWRYCSQLVTPPNFGTLVDVNVIWRGCRGAVCLPKSDFTWIPIVAPPCYSVNKHDSGRLDRIRHIASDRQSSLVVQVIVCRQLGPK